MNQVERLYKIEQLLGEAHTVPISAMLERLAVRVALEIATREARNFAAAWDAFFAGR